MKRTQPDVLTDEALNKFITGVLLDAREQGDAGHVLMGNTLITRTVEQLRAYFPGAYDVLTQPTDAQRAQEWPKLAGSA